MPPLFPQPSSLSPLTNRKHNFDSSSRLLNRALLPYERQIKTFEKKAGPRPPLPADLPASRWSKSALKVLKERYLEKDFSGKVTETPDQMCWRVAWDIARVEVKWGKTRQEVVHLAKKFYRLLVSHRFLPNSPTLMNAGKSNRLQYSACFVIPVGDSLPGIFDAIKYQALIHQSGGGTGFAFSRLRPHGSVVGSSRGVASGPVSFMRVFDAATQQIKQGGTRRGANMGILRVDHPDIRQFIRCKTDGGITNFNISVAATNAFMQALEQDTDYDLIDPHTGEIIGQEKASEIMDEIVKAAHATGDPGMIFIDRMNASSANPVPSLGPIESTNPCGEQPLYPFDACNLGSLFLGHFVKPANGTVDIDWDRLRQDTHLAVRFLDNVIEANPYPLPQIRRTVRQLRRIGLGVGGWADLLIRLGIPYDSQPALELAEKVMAFINREGHHQSRQLAAERGPFSLFSQSIYAGKSPLRNSTVTTIAPTGSIGILADASPGIEPLFALSFRHIVRTENRTLIFVNRDFKRQLKSRHLATDQILGYVKQHGTIRHFDQIPQDLKQIFGTAHEIHPDWHIKMQAAFQKHTDNAVSKTINLPHEAQVADVKSAYLLAWQTDCKGITVFRDGSKSHQVLNLGVTPKSPAPASPSSGLRFAVAESKGEPAATPTQKQDQAQPSQALIPRPLRAAGATYRIKTPLGTAFITVNQDEASNPMEIFINIGKAGSEVAAMAEALGRMISATLRFGNHLQPINRAQELINQLQGIGGGRTIGFGPNKVRSLPDAVAKALSWHFGLQPIPVPQETDFSSSNASPPAGETVSPGQLNLTDPAEVASLRAPDPKLAPLADLCPSCHNPTLVYQEGCTKCLSCGHSEC